MGYEKGITRKWRDMILDGDYPDRIPGGPRGPDSPSGGTPNHELLARTARLTWALEKGTQAQRDEELDGVVRFFDNQIEGGFMTRGRANEQLSPSHSQWWITAVLGLRWLGWTLRESDPATSGKLMAVTGRWLRHHHAICRQFSTRQGIVVPGARAWPEPLPGKKYSGRCKLRDELFDAVESGRVRRLWPSEHLDMLGLFFADKLLRAGDNLGGARQSKELPKLRWPVSLRRDGESFTAWLTSIEGSDNLRCQRRATWRGAEDTYGFDDDPEDEWPETIRLIVGERPEGGDGGDGGHGGGFPGLLADLRDLAQRRPAARNEVLALVAQLEALGGPGPGTPAIVTGLRELAERRPASRGELMDLAARLQALQA